MNVFKVGPIRPPSEANSLLLQVTQGCTWNKCKFCHLYRDTKFKAFSVEDVKSDIDIMKRIAERIQEKKTSKGWDIEALNEEISGLFGEEQQCYYMMANWLISGGENVFLQDGNTLALKGGKLSEVLTHLKKTFPSIKRITSYGRAESLSRVSVEDLIELREAGLSRVHSGYESGCDKVLSLINKGVTAQEEIVAGKNIKKAGIELSIYFMPGIGGKELSLDNAIETAHVINQVEPDFVRIRTAAIKPGTELYDEYEKGNMHLCSEDDKVLEIRKLIEKSNEINTNIVSDHMLNLLQNIEGNLLTDKEKLLNKVDSYFDLPIIERRRFQIQKRLGKRLSDEELNALNEEEWDFEINRILCSFV